MLFSAAIIMRIVENTVSKITDQAYLKDEQYKSVDKLQARIALHQRFSTNPNNWQRWVFDQLEIKPGLRVLEVGCGPASLWRENLDRLPVDLEVCMGDYSIGMAQSARQALVGKSGFSFTNLDAQRLPYSDAEFDLVVANHMLYHLPDVRAGLSELRRVLQPGGQLCAATNGLGHMAELNQLVYQFNWRDDALRFPTRSFCLENGPDQVGEFFQNVQVRFYEDNLLVTEPGPLRAYILSMWNAMEDARPEVMAAFDQTLERIFTEQGSFFIRKSAGVILAV
jgi:ubiquinone/menaquinone biosynthesis C-methylase UbiE